MEKLMVTHRLSLDMSSQAVQATITLAQGDTATHRLIVSLRNGAEVVELPPGSYAAIAVQNPDAEVDVLDSVTVYGHDGVFPDCIVYDVSAYITQNEGFHEACFEVTHVDNDGLKLLSSPRIAFVVKREMLCGSNVETNTKTQYYGAIIQAQAAAEEARDDAKTAQAAAEEARYDAQTAQAAAEEARDDAQAVGVVTGISVANNGRLEFCFSDGRKVQTDIDLRKTEGAYGIMPHIKDGYWYIGEYNTNVKATGIDIAEIQASASEDDDGINVVTIKLSNGNEFDFQVKNGSKGKTGDEFVMFYADYGTIAEMEAAVADQTDDGVPINGLVMIEKDPTIVDGDNATGRIYRKVLKEDGTYEYKFMGDLSGLQGPQGLKGNDGETPVCGKDYFTNDEIESFKDDIKQYVNAAILNGEW